MDKLIKVKESQFASFSSFLNAEQDKLRKEMDALENNLAELRNQFKDNENLISELGLNSIKQHQSNGIEGKAEHNDYKIIKFTSIDNRKSKYLQKWSWWEKIKYVLEVNKNPMAAKQLINEIYLLEPSLKLQSEKTMKRNEINVFATLSIKNKSGLLKRIKNGNQSVYGMVTWFDEKGELKVRL